MAHKIKYKRLVLTQKQGEKGSISLKKPRYSRRLRAVAVFQSEKIEEHSDKNEPEIYPGGFVKADLELL